MFNFIFFLQNDVKISYIYGLVSTRKSTGLEENESIRRSNQLTQKLCDTPNIIFFEELQIYVLYRQLDGILEVNCKTYLVNPQEYVFAN